MQIQTQNKFPINRGYQPRIVLQVPTYEDSSRDTFTQSSEAEWVPPTGRQFAQLFGGGSNSQELRDIGKLVESRGEGGFLTKRELRDLSPSNFADPRNAKKLDVVPADLLIRAIANVLNPSANSLLYTNNPERINEPNILLNQGDIPAGRTRVLSHHLNDTSQSLQLTTTFKNNSSKIVNLRVEKKALRLMDEGYAARAGLNAYKDYLAPQQSEEHPIKPGSSYTFEQGEMAPGQVSTSLAAITTDGPLRATTVATSGGTKPSSVVKPAIREVGDTSTAATKRKNKDKPALKYRGSGVYKNPDRHFTGTIPMNENKMYQLEIGPETVGDNGATYDGEFGQEKRFTLVVGEDAKPGQRLAVVAWAGGNDPVGVRSVNHPDRVMEISAKTSWKNQAAVLFEGEVKAGQVLDMTQMIQAGAATPLRLFVIPVPPAQAKPNPSKNG